MGRMAITFLSLGVGAPCLHSQVAVALSQGLIVGAFSIHCSVASLKSQTHLQ